MPTVLDAPLFYAVEIAEGDLFRLAIGAVEPPPVDVVNFPDEDGGDAERELGVPFLPGMDEVHVESAQLQLRSGTKSMDIDGYAIVKESATNDTGIVVSLTTPGRLRAVELTYPTFPKSVRDAPDRFTLLGRKIASRTDGGEKPLHVVVRPATTNGGGFTYGPPIYADPDFSAPGPMFGRVLSGITVRDLTAGRLEIGFPGLAGPAWLIQLAHGDQVANLTPIPFSTQVNRVTIDATTSNVSLVIPSSPADVVLWSQPGPFLPEAGVQDVAFVPLAEKTLSARLTESSGASAPPTIAVPLRFHSDSGGAIDVVAKALTTTFLVHALGRDPVTFRLGGSWTALALSAPGGRRPVQTSARLVVRLLGRELNGGSPVPSSTPPTAGGRIGPRRWAAGSVPIAPLPGAAPGSSLSLASLRVYLAAPRAAEVALELRRDVAGVPGPVVGKPLVSQLAAGFSDWLECELPQPLTVVAGGERVWVSLRTTGEEVFWFGDGPGLPLLSGDRGATWAEPEPALAAAGAPLLQLFHLLPPPLPPPALEVRHDEVLLAANLFAAATPISPDSPGEFAAENGLLPDHLPALLAATTGSNRTTTTLHLFTRSVCDLTVERLTLSYDPFQAGG